MSSINSVVASRRAMMERHSAPAAPHPPASVVRRPWSSRRPATVTHRSDGRSARQSSTQPRADRFQKRRGLGPAAAASSQARRQRSAHPVDPERRRLLTRRTGLSPLRCRSAVGDALNKVTFTLLSLDDKLKTVSH